MISLIAAVDVHRGIGNKNSLLCHLPADLQYFKSMTLGKPVIMGRKTLESIGRALPGRQNIVLTHGWSTFTGVDVCNSLEQALQLSASAPEVMIIGGESVFADALPLADCVYLTFINQEFEADAFFPELDPDVWDCIGKVDRPSDDKNAYSLTFCYYVRKNLQKVVDISSWMSRIRSTPSGRMLIKNSEKTNCVGALNCL
jgi:dihydrofolate reductase